ncbi:alpha/beta fold hydrolase [Salinispora fenicalii]|uniref:alpha/beta fold hydrolase n=1 Tax=Salinispora fenicalii TaxID=1137263 RepID=UPI0004883A00|nr:alpha/beta hydrolase [Salinispora fenicalii]
MLKVTSADGTAIAYERYGEHGADSLIVVGGATCDRAKTRQLAEGLGAHLPVVNYDRRGRGDSGDSSPYAVEREVEDIAALVNDLGADAILYGHSSGAALVLHAAAAGVPAKAIVLHEPPFGADIDEDRQEARDYAEALTTLLSEDRRDDAVALFFQTTGVPAEVVAELRHEPWWADVVALAPTLAYDSAVMGDRSRGGILPVEVAARVSVPALVLSGGESPDWMIEVARAAAAALPQGTHRVLPGEGHIPSSQTLAPVLTEFIARGCTVDDTGTDLHTPG